MHLSIGQFWIRQGIKNNLCLYQLPFFLNTGTSLWWTDEFIFLLTHMAVLFFNWFLVPQAFQKAGMSSRAFIFWLCASGDSSHFGKIGLCPLASDLLAIDLQRTVYLLRRRWSANLEGLEMALSFSRWQVLFSTGFWHMCCHPSMSRRHLLIWVLEMLLLKTRNCSSSI